MTRHRDFRAEEGTRELRTGRRVLRLHRRPFAMKLKRAVIDAREAWRVAAKELDDAIGIEVLEEPVPAASDVLNLRRFRRALLNERETRLRYAAALRADNKPIPDDLLWDVPEEEQP